MKITSITTYPIKSLGGVALERSALTAAGLQHDREWMLVDENGKLVSQREFPVLSLFRVLLFEDRLHVIYNDNMCVIPFSFQGNNKIACKIFSTDVIGGIVDQSISDWFSAHLDCTVHLVRALSDEPRTVKNHPDSAVLFPDSSPFLFISEASLSHLNDKLDRPVLMNRFRPNIVFDAATPHIEDDFTSIYINDAKFEGIKNCGRCKMTTIDQRTGEIGIEPLRTLATYRKQENKILFGRYLACKNWTEKVIQVGDQIRIVE